MFEHKTFNLEKNKSINPMKNIIPLCSFFFCFAFLSAQTKLTYSTNQTLVTNSVGKETVETKSESIKKMHKATQIYKKRSPVYDFYETGLNNVDTIPEYRYKSNKVKITGTIYERDGVTPANNVLLFIHQTDENGKFKLKRFYKKRYVHHRAWIKTDANGKFTFYTFIPGRFKYSSGLQQILPIIKEPFKEEYKIKPFVFNLNGLLSKGYIKKITQAKNSGSFLELVKIKNEKNKDHNEVMYVATKNIVLGNSIEKYY